MAAYDSVDLLARLRKQIRRPTADETLTDAQAYEALTDGQQALYEDVMVRAPEIMVGAPAAMTTADSKVFVFGTDANGDAIVPMGKVGIYTSLALVPDYPWSEGEDYLNEGSQIRIPNNTTFSGTLYWRGVVSPAPISAASAPTFKPASDRLLIVYWAAASYAGWGDLRDPTSYRSLYTEGLGRLLLRLKTQFKAGPAYSLSGLQIRMGS